MGDRLHGRIINSDGAEPSVPVDNASVAAADKAVLYASVVAFFASNS